MVAPPAQVVQVVLVAVLPAVLLAMAVWAATGVPVDMEPTGSAVRQMVMMAPMVAMGAMVEKAGLGVLAVSQLLQVWRESMPEAEMEGPQVGAAMAAMAHRMQDSLVAPGMVEMVETQARLAGVAWVPVWLPVAPMVLV